jgi:hypothetical protein
MSQSLKKAPEQRGCHSAAAVNWMHDDVLDGGTQAPVDDGPRKADHVISSQAGTAPSASSTAAVDLSERSGHQLAESYGRRTASGGKCRSWCKAMGPAGRLDMVQALDERNAAAPPSQI